MGGWTWAALSAAALIAAGALYVCVRWRRSPQAFRAMAAVAVAYFIAGALAGAWVVHLSTPTPLEVATREAPSSAPAAPLPPSVPTSVPVSPCINCGPPAAMPSAAAVSLPTRTYDPVHAPRPDPKLTPGHVFPNVTKEDVCTPGWAHEHRHVTESEKASVYAEYPDSAKTCLCSGGVGNCCEVDHLIPLELGGSNDIKNLWPQPNTPRPGDGEKDGLENTLHELVCKGELPLADAQKCIASDWVACWEKYVVPKYGPEWAAANRRGW